MRGAEVWRRGLRAALTLAILLLAAVDGAAQSAADQEYLLRLQRVESGGNAAALNRFGYAGLYQMGVPALIDAGWVQRRPGAGGGNDWSNVAWTDKARAAGVGSINDFLGNAGAQNSAMGDLLGVQRRYMASMGLNRYIGQTIGGRVIMEHDILAAVHNAGPGGAAAWLSSGGAVNPTDGNGVGVGAYVARVNGAEGGTPGGGGAGGAGGEGPAPGCDAGVRVRLADAGRDGADNALRIAQATYRPPAPILGGGGTGSTLASCVDGMLRQMSFLKPLSMGIDLGGAIDAILGMIEQQACEYMQKQFSKVAAEQFNPQAFLGMGLPAGIPLTIGSIIQRAPGGGG